MVPAAFDAQGRLRIAEEMMTDESFARVRSGKDTQADVLRELGCPYGQGYLFSRPVPAEQAAWLIGRRLA